MKLLIADYNDASSVLATYEDAWIDLEQVLHGMPLHLKASDQAGIQGTPIFDVVGTNEYIRENLLRTAQGWQANIPIPEELDFLGTDIDLAKHGMVVEVQFSNYPFLLNNLLRSELFHKESAIFTGEPQRVVVIVTKGGMFPASNSTLYYEQAERQLSALARFQVFDVPIRLVGLAEDVDSEVEVVWSEYTAKRYSRTALVRESRRCQIYGGKSRARLELIGAELVK